MDVGAWLRELGLAQYEQAFHDNDVDATLLPTLTDADLRDLGVASLGHRKRLLGAIAAPAGIRGPSSPAASAAAAGPLPASAPTLAERRQLTVMFCDLVGSTALSASLDPEDLREVIGAYHRRVAADVERLGGFVAKYMGDGVLAYFGYPAAHEDDAERAVRAALQVVAAVRELRPSVGGSLQVRIGIATGLVVVGDLLGSGAAQEEAVVGETPNLAARLQALAEPDSVVIAAATRRLVGDLFECADLDAVEAKGFAEPIRAWRVLGASRARDRFEARHAGELLPLVGREHELALLLDRFQQVREGEGQVVLLSGEPGIGKSRLVRALRERLADEPYTLLSHFCSPFHQTSALYPVIDRLERAAGLARDEPPSRKLEKLEGLLARSTSNPAAITPLIATLLSIPIGDRYPPPDLTPQRQKELTLDALLQQLAALALDRPVVALFEDVHWADPSTLELLERVIERAQRLPLLVLVTFRPEFAPPWHGQPHLTALALNRLSRKRGATLVAELTGGKPLPAEVVEQILLKTDGVPLFVEELTKAVLESGLVGDAGSRYELLGPLQPLAIPPTLRDSLMARLDRLAAVKEVAQIAACIGREFSHDLLAAVVTLDEAGLGDALRQLTQAELIFGQGAPPQASYIFKHALVRDAAYESLLKSRRQALHARLARVLEQRFPEVAQAQPEMLARHFTEAGLAPEAVAYWLEAGRQAVARSANAAAMAQLNRGLELLDELPDDPARQELELELRTVLGGALIAAKGWAAEQTGQAFARARELCGRTGNTAQLFPVMVGQWTFHVNRGEIGAALRVGQEMLDLAQRQQELAAEVMAHRLVGPALLYLGDLGPARGHLERALDLYDPAHHGRLAFDYVHLDPRVAGLNSLSWVLFVLGYPEQARTRGLEAQAYASALSHVMTTSIGLFQGGCLCQFSRDHQGVLDRADGLIALATEQSQPQHLALGTMLRGWALAAGDAEAGSRQVREGLAAYRGTGAEQWLPYFLALLAEGLGPAPEALEILGEALARADRTGERWFEPELHRRRGEVLRTLLPASSLEAESCYRRALTLAHGQGARAWELRAATSLARLWHDQGRTDEARELLTPVHAQFTEGFDTPDLLDAKALLDELP